MNTRIPLKNSKIYTRENWSSSKNGTDMFEGDENANTERNNRTMVDFDYNSNNM